ncbi:TonB-dependent receptor [Deminuibacter soli]|uniref:TonB-dependent receptor n=1 Tax=Deminuibacter soli TaxID=2291815 RepID=A0A3E1NI78_9BACT|nr:TonB-dependent receptor [Deminuibacter soli]RFM27645.1 TonB-dependent receptor [Deminuibacter soli]
MRSIITALLCTIFLAFQAQAAVIRGHVIAWETGEVLTGATITVTGTGFKTVSALDGSFILKQVPAGSYTVSISMVGYATLTREITVDETGSGLVDVALQPAHTRLENITIRAGRDKNNDAGARNIERTASQVMNVVSAKAIEVSPDMTVANVVQRVSGVSVERNSNGDGQYAILRGMDKRYNYTLVNGVKIPSPDNKYRYVPLDIFPSDMIDRLEVYKALTPAMEGDAVGGAINMVMKEAPSHKMIHANIAGSYSELFMNRDFTGFKPGSVNSQSPYELHGSNYSANSSDFSAATTTYTNKRPLPGLIGGLALGNRFLNNKLGVLVAGSYQNTYRGSNSLFMGSETVDTLKGVKLTSQENRRISEQQLRYGIHARVDYALNARNHFSWYNAFMNLTNNQVRDEVSTSFASGYDPQKGNAQLTYSTRARKTVQHIYNSTLQGDHTLTNKLSLNWSAVYSKASSEQPDNTTVSLDGLQQNFVQTRTTVQNSGTSHRWEHNNDRDWAGYLNLTWLQPVGQLPVEWKLGGLYRDKHRDNFYNSYQFVPSYIQQYGKDFTEYNQIQWNVQNPQGSVASGLTYSASEKTSAGYLQFKVMAKQLEVTGGVRAEHTDQGYAMKYPIGEDAPVGSQQYTDWLPSLHFKYMPFAKTNIRASYFRSVNRPGFAEINPAPVVGDEYTERGDPKLKHAVADNFDLRYELYPHAAEQLMAGIFYKHIKDPIEYTLQQMAHNIYYMPGNFGNANNYGAELDWTIFFNKIGIKANYTYTHSRITSSKSKRIRDSSTNGSLQTITVPQTRPLYGQSAHVANISLLYKDVQHGWNAQLSANYTGKRINTVAQFVDNDIWQRGFVQLDASAEKTICKHWVVFAKANNLLNTPLTLFVNNVTAQNAGAPNQDLSNKTLIRRDYYQRFYIAGVRYTF